MSTDDLATGRILSDVFPGSRIGGADYLRWLYRDSPAGPVVETNIDDEAGRSAHYAVVPCRFATREREITVGLSLNTAVSERARGGGVFTRIAEQTIEAAREQGYDAIVGVANANSTPGFLRRLGFTLIASLPATVLVPRPGKGPAVETLAAGALDVAGDPAVAELLASVHRPARGIEPVWSPESLAWRLASPGARYAVHRLPGALVVSTSERRSGVDVAVILAMLADHDLDRAEVDAIVRAACRRHRAPFALHAGVHAGADVRGVPLPRRLRPSPLNLIFRWLDPDQLAAPHVGRFEFLDFDAY